MKAIETADFSDINVEYTLRGALYVIEHRMIPNILDNKTDVQRRLIYTMFKDGLMHQSKRRKSSTIVGLTMIIHPHGDAGIEGALYTLGQPFKKMIPYADIEGNVGSIAGDSPASARYTEVRLSEYGEKNFVQDLNPVVVDFVPDYEGRGQEPTVLPSIIPDILVNGNFGIASGFVTSLLPHNPFSVTQACIAYLKNRNIRVEELIKIIKAPDFPGGGTIVGTASIEEAYRTGEGKCLQRGKWRRVDEKNGTFIEIYEIPYNTTTETIIDGIKSIVVKADEGKLVSYFDSYEDYTNSFGIKLRLKVTDPAHYDNAVNQMIQYTSMQTNHIIKHYVLDKGKLKLVNLLDIISTCIEFREDCLFRKFRHRIKEIDKRLHLIDGILRVDDNTLLHKIIDDIKKAKGKEESIIKVMKYKFSREQAEYIVNLKLYRLNTLDLKSFKDEKKDISQEKSELVKLCNGKNNKYITEFMINELEDLRKELRFKSSRNTDIIEKDTIAKITNVIPCSVTRSAKDTIAVGNFKAVETVKSFTQGIIYVFTNLGYIYSINVPKIMRNANLNMREYFKFKPEEKIVGMFSSTPSENINLLLVGRTKFKKLVLDKDFRTGTSGKRMFVGEPLEYVREKYNHFHISDGSGKVKFNIDDIQPNTLISFKEIMNNNKRSISLQIL